MTLRIPQQLPGLNEIIAESKKHPKAYARLKAKWGKVVGLYALAAGLKRITAPAHWEYAFEEPARQRDPSNIAAGAIKIIEDALQDAGLLKNDGWGWVLSISSTFRVTPGRASVTVTIR